MPPHPVFTDEYIKRKCPENHPPPLTKVNNILPSGMPAYLQTLPGIKVAAPVIQSPQTMNVMAKQLAAGRLQSEKALIAAQNAVLATYEKPAKSVEMPPSTNLRGAKDVGDVGNKNSMMSAVATTAALYGGAMAAQLAQ